MLRSYPQKAFYLRAGPEGNIHSNPSSTEIKPSIMKTSKIQNLKSAISNLKFPTALAALLAASTLNLQGADTVITSDTEWDGGTHDPDNNAVLLISDPGNGPTLTLTNSASASWEGATVVGNFDGESGHLVIQSGSELDNIGSWGTLKNFGPSSVIRGSGYVGLNSGSMGEALVTGSGSTWTNSQALYVGSRGTGTLEIADGGAVVNDWGYIGMTSGSVGEVLVTGSGSQWTNSGGLIVGSQGMGSLKIADGGTVSNTAGFIGYNNGGMGEVLVTGGGSQWTNTGDLILGGLGLAFETTGIGTLTIADGGLVAVEGSSRVWSDSEIHLQVSNNGMLQIDGNLTNDGLLRLAASPLLGTGFHTPVEMGGTLSGTGEIRAIGGTWDAGEREFIVATAANTTSGSGIQIDASTTQRLNVTGSEGGVLIALQADAESEENDSLIQFTSTEMSTSSIAGQEVLSAWAFDTDLAFGTEIQLSLEIGSEWNPALLAVWHSTDDGTNWNLFETDIFYEDQFASFFVESFSSYAVTVIPEPSSAMLLLLAGGALGLLRRRETAG